jgi:hypothetical protein
LKNDVNVPSKSKKQKTCGKKLFFVGVLRSLQKEQDLELDLDLLVRGTDPYQYVNPENC